MLDLLFTNTPAFIVIFGGIILAIGIHEAAHCYMADHLGDPTSRSLGRLTLNPIAHLDPLGTLVLLVTGAFGWGRPSPFDPYNLQDPKRDTALIALAGPASNLLITLLLGLLLRFTSLPTTIQVIVYGLARLNVNLAIFNLIPLAPLDGSKVIGLFTSHETALRLQHQTNPLLLLLLVIPIFGGLSLAAIVVLPISSFFLSLLLP